MVAFHSRAEATVMTQNMRNANSALMWSVMLFMNSLTTNT